jgi:hypothetical protein
VFESERYNEIAVKAMRPFSLTTDAGGVTTFTEDGPFYEEYPSQPPRHVLNGFIYALFGLRDLVRFTNNAEADRLWQDGLATLKKWLPRYDIGFWSLYQLPESPRNPATVPYHRLHVNQLSVLAQITSESIFVQYRDLWQSYLASRMKAWRTLPSKLRWLSGSGF